MLLASFTFAGGSPKNIKNMQHRLSLNKHTKLHKEAANATSFESTYSMLRVEETLDHTYTVICTLTDNCIVHKACLWDNPGGPDS